MSDTYKLKIRPEKVAIVEGMKEKLSSEGVVLIANVINIKNAEAFYQYIAKEVYYERYIQIENSS